MLYHAKWMLGRYISSQACQLIKGLLEKVPAKRLDVLAIKSTDFFHHVDWVKLFNLDVKPPVLPKVAGPMDISNIPEKYTRDEAPVDSPVSPSSLLSPTKADLFSGFTFDDGEPAAELLQCSCLASFDGPETRVLHSQPTESPHQCLSDRSSQNSGSKIGELSLSQLSQVELDSDVSDHYGIIMLALC